MSEWLLDPSKLIPAEPGLIGVILSVVPRSGGKVTERRDMILAWRQEWPGYRAPVFRKDPEPWEMALLEIAGQFQALEQQGKVYWDLKAAYEDVRKRYQEEARKISAAIRKENPELFPA